MWVNSSHRNQGIVFQMIEVIRREIFLQLMCHRSNIAWTSPTRDGLRFIERYLKHRENSNINQKINYWLYDHTQNNNQSNNQNHNQSNNQSNDNK